MNIPEPERKAGDLNFHGSPGQFVRSSVCEFILPVDTPFVNSFYEDGAVIVNRSGPGARHTTGSDLLSALTVAGLISADQFSKNYMSTAQYALETILVFHEGLKEDCNAGIHGFQENIQVKGTDGNLLDCLLTFSVPSLASTSFKIQWVPTALNENKVKDLINHLNPKPFNIVTLKRDKNDAGTFWVKSDTPEDKIPHWLFIDGLVASYPTFSPLKVVVRGRTQDCPHCDATALDHPHFRCPKRKEHAAQLRKLHNIRAKELRARAKLQEQQQTSVQHFAPNQENVTQSDIAFALVQPSLPFQEEPKAPSPSKPTQNPPREKTLRKWEVKALEEKKRKDAIAESIEIFRKEDEARRQAKGSKNKSEKIKSPKSSSPAKTKLATETTESNTEGKSAEEKSSASSKGEPSVIEVPKPAAQELPPKTVELTNKPKSSELPRPATPVMTKPKPKNSSTPNPQKKKNFQLINKMAVSGKHSKRPRDEKSPEDLASPAKKRDGTKKAEREVTPAKIYGKDSPVLKLVQEIDNSQAASSVVSEKELRSLTSLFSSGQSSMIWDPKGQSLQGEETVPSSPQGEDNSSSPGLQIDIEKFPDEPDSNLVFSESSSLENAREDQTTNQEISRIAASPDISVEESTQQEISSISQSFHPAIEILEELPFVPDNNIPPLTKNGHLFEPRVVGGWQYPKDIRHLEKVSHLTFLQMLMLQNMVADKDMYTNIHLFKAKLQWWPNMDTRSGIRAYRDLTCTLNRIIQGKPTDITFTRRLYKKCLAEAPF